MGKNTYSKEQLDWLRDNAGRLPLRELANHVGRKPRTLAASLLRFKIDYLKTTLAQENSQLQKQNKRKCSGCKNVLELSIANFSLRKSRAIGSTPRLLFNSLCHECRKNYHKNYNQRQNSQRAYDLPSWIDYRLLIAQREAKNRAYKSVLITRADILDIYEKQAGTCYYSKLPMLIILNHPESLSIDRIDSSKPYTKDNVVLCCSAINRMKNKYQQGDFIKWCKLVAQSHP